ncbi:uncharacterized protein EDB93DRAFT_1252621 [Suillus bovinus]|uniref:uncharacterized protein n=1 Tax=Suillus bovinus TaxID=48563 RepID=UPI001B866174|nr:uncharacterized protein EDB93DRAFT_1252621 [Suillus bovinus]KAG2141154.1 hypothetical protein EDB93DRAFT_1252621 [Suillus bovinus]
MKSNDGPVFLSIAEELRFYILRFLPYRDILRCASVCKALRQTYVSSSSLQYIVELGGQHLLPISNADDHTPISERLQCLKDKAHAWFRVDIRSAKTISIPHQALYWESFMADRHLFLWDKLEVDTATIIPILTKPSQRSVERDWHPGTMCKVPNSTNICTFMDPAQNLFAVAYVDQIHETFFINLTTLDNGSFHPQAAGPTLFLSEFFEYEDSDSGAVRLKVMGRYIALQRASSEFGTWQLQIWDWQHSITSDNVLRISDGYPHSIEFCFLGNDRLLVVADNLKLYSIEDMSHTPQLLASFVLPIRLLGSTACILPVDGMECSSQLQMQAQQTVHTSDPKHRLLCITMTKFSRAFIIYIISTRIFFDLPEMAGAMPIPWQCWGPSNTRVDWHPIANGECKVHLSRNRVLLLVPDYEEIRDSKCKLCIMDFSPLAVTNRRGLGKVVIEPSPVNVNNIMCVHNGIQKRLSTFLPYVEVVLDRKFGMHELKNIWMDEDGIYLLSEKLIEVIDV